MDGVMVRFRMLEMDVVGMLKIPSISSAQC
ncbi:MAG: hypothetical protein IKX88_09580 [Thermoguttaceae bacterium]|nr:hypothetical protein [Thermoguttaceae bacterium]